MPVVAFSTSGAPRPVVGSLRATQQERRVVKLMRDGQLYYLGRLAPAEARAALDAASEEYARTGTIANARTVRVVERCPTPDADGPAPEEPQAPVQSVGEHGIMRAVLLQTIRDLKDESPVIRNAAVRWFRDDGRGYLFSFASICDELDFDAGKLRCELLAAR